MTLTINDTTMTSDQTPHTAWHAPSQSGWQVSWLPGRTLDRNTAITAMILADTTADEPVRKGHRLWPRLQGWAVVLGLTRPDAIGAVSQPPGDHSREREPDGGQLHLEDADDAVRDRAARWVAHQLANDQAVLVVDETGDEKSSTDAVGAARQYSGALGGIGLCQVAVFLTYASGRGRPSSTGRCTCPGTGQPTTSAAS